MTHMIPHVNEQTFVALTRMFARTWNCVFLARFKSHCKGNCQVPGALTTPRKRYRQDCTGGEVLGSLQSRKNYKKAITIESYIHGLALTGVSAQQ